MSNFTTAQLESESCPVFDLIPTLGNKSDYSQKTTGQGIGVTPAGWIYDSFPAETESKVPIDLDPLGFTIETTAHNVDCSVDIILETIPTPGGTFSGWLTAWAVDSSPGVTIATIPMPNVTFGALAAITSKALSTRGWLDQWALANRQLETGSYNDSRLSDIERNFEFRKKSTALRFLRQNDFLIPLILESAERIRSYFEKNARLIIELVEDTESEGFEELFLIVKTLHTPAEASRLLERFDAEWWLHASRQAQCKLNIDYELTDVRLG